MPLALTHSPVDPDEQMLTKHCISRPVSRSDQDRNTKTTGMDYIRQELLEPVLLQDGADGDIYYYTIYLV